MTAGPKAETAGEEAEWDQPLDVDQLFALAVTGRRFPLPHRTVLERSFGRPLDHVEAYANPWATAALRAMGAVAATRGHQVLLADTSPDLRTVAHEVAHVVQADAASEEPTHEPGPQKATTGTPDEATTTPDVPPTGGTRVATPQAEHTGPPHGVLPAEALEEREAEEIADAVARRPGTPAAGPIRRRSLDRPHIALLRAAPEAPEATIAPSDGAEALRHSSSAPVPAPSAPAPSPPAPAPAASPATVGSATATPTGTVGLAAETTDTPQLEPAQPPEPGVTAEDVAARQAALIEAETALPEATDVAGLVRGFADAPPTVKARNQRRVGDQADRLVTDEAATYEEEVPDLTVAMSGDVEEPGSVQVPTPPAGEVTLEPTPPPPAPDPNIPDTPPAGRFTGNADVADVFTRQIASGDSSARAERIGESLRDVQTVDPDIPRSPGPAPTVPREGESDPQRLASMGTAGARSARGARDEAQRAVVEGPGPERAQPTRLDEAVPVEGLQVPEVRGPEGADGPDAYLAMGLAPDVQVAFDAGQGESMQQSMAGAVERTDQAVVDRDQSREEEVANAEARSAELSEQADRDQREHVTTARDRIQSERTATMRQQADEVAAVEHDADARKEDDRRRIDDQVADNEERISNRYDTAQSDIDDEVAEGERRAEQEKRDAERDAEDESWWDRATRWIREAFDALVSAIGDIFDAVREAVSSVLEAARDFATRLIDAAASFIKDAIEAFGEFLKSAVDALLGDIFPELARALNEAIDAAVTAATALVDAVAEGLKSAVNSVVDALKAGLNAILDVFQAAINAALAFVQAALTGDWSALALMVLEAVLAVVGIDPEQFYAFVGRAQDTFQRILDDPGGFVSNLIDAFVGGIRQFKDNFLTHLQAGIIGWLTGALGSTGITLPERFDLRGVLDLLRQILGLTWERLRTTAVRLVGEQNVERLEYIAGWIETLVSEGWSGLWERIQDSVASVRDRILEGIKDFLVERIIVAAITRLATMFNPVGALVNLVLTAWNVYTFLRDQMQRIVQIVEAVVNALSDIARGILGPAMDKVEDVLARLLPLAIDLLARILNLGNIGGRVRRILERVQETIDRAIEQLIRRVMRAFSSGGRGGRERTEEPSAADGVGATQDEGGFREAFTVEGEQHSLFVDSTGQLKIASATRTLLEWVADLKDKVSRLSDANQKRRLTASLRAVESELSKLPPRVGRARTRAGTRGGGARLDRLSSRVRTLMTIAFEGAHTGRTQDDAIPILFYKRRRDFRQLALERDGDRFAARPSGQTELSSRTGRTRVTIGVDPQYWPEEGATFKKSREGSASARRGRKTATFRTMLEQHGWDPPGGADDYEVDHVRDLGYSGRDFWSNLWPLARNINQRQRESRLQFVLVQHRGQIDVRYVKDLSGKWLRVAGYL